MCIGSKQKLCTSSDEIFDISINGLQINESQCEQVLGVFVDATFSWTANINNIIKNVNSSLALLRRIKKYLNHKTRILFYNAYILPHLDYCCSIWGDCSKYLLESLLKLQKRTARIILDEHDLKKQSSELFRECGIVPITKRILYHKALLMNKSKNELAPEYLSNLIVSANNKESYDTRFSSSDNFLVPKPNTELYKSSFSFSGPKVWNSLPSEIKTSKIVFEFKNSYKL